MIRDRSKAPYIRDSIKIDRSMFLNQGKQSYISSKFYKTVNGHNANFNLSSVIKSSIGEFIERHSLLTHPYKIGDMIPSFHLTSGKIINVPAEQIVFIKNSVFNDSCGVASHLNSKNAVEKAFFEFFERHSLIFNWLTKSRGKRIDLKKFNSEKISKLQWLLLKYVDEIHLFEISLHPLIKVVFGIGIGEFYKTLGISAKLNVTEAVESTMEEMYQTFGSAWSKSYVTRIDDNLQFDHFDMYLQNYYSLSPTILRDEYSYLIDESVEYDENTSSDLTLKEIINLVEYDLGIEIYGCFIPTFHNGFYTKIVKVFSPEGYPHMYPVEFNHAQTKISFNKTVKDFPNAFRPIPFP
ncbi:MAG: YcaO-like family protein [Heyndrickxia coagulans]|jgi:hypothetical protein